MFCVAFLFVYAMHNLESAILILICEEKLYIYSHLKSLYPTIDLPPFNLQEPEDMLSVDNLKLSLFSWLWSTAAPIFYLKYPERTNCHALKLPVINMP